MTFGKQDNKNTGMIAQSTSVGESELNESTVRKLSEAKKEPAWLLQRRLAALKQFEELPLPQLSYGLHVSSALNINLKDLRPQECITTHQADELDGLIIEDLSTAATKYENVLRPLMGNNTSQNKFDALHSAFWNNGIFVYIKKGGKGSKKLLLRQKQTEIVHVVVAAEEGADINITELLSSEAAMEIPKSYRVEVVDVIAAEDSKVRFATLQKLGDNVQGMISRKAAIGRGANADWIDISIGGGSTKLEIVSSLNGEGATTKTLGAFFGDNTQQLDMMAKAVHNERNTTSNIRVKGALKGRSKAIVQSFTKIMKNASNSAGHQKANVLLLSDSARASPIPKLEIDNYDVKASHEASVGQLDAEKLFYLMSRGLDSNEAVKLVVEGFFEPLLREIQFEEIAEDLRQTISARLANSGTELLNAMQK